jgi:hypothetical protein
VWSALLSVLILSAAVVAPAVAAPPAVKVETLRQKCAKLFMKVYGAYKEAGASDATAHAEALRAENLCMERGKK